MNEEEGGGRYATNERGGPPALRQQRKSAFARKPRVAAAQLLVRDAPRPRPSRPNNMPLLPPLSPTTPSHGHLSTSSVRDQPRHYHCATHGSSAYLLPSPG